MSIAGIRFGCNAGRAGAVCAFSEKDKYSNRNTAENNFVMACKRFVYAKQQRFGISRGTNTGHFRPNHF